MRMSATFVLFILLVTAGCENGPKIVKIKGIATSDGKPVAGLVVNFQPEFGRPSWGLSNKDGRFELEYDEKTKGVLIGRHTVSATFMEDELAGIKMTPDVRKIVTKYGDSAASPLKLEITVPSESFEVKFD
jgi:hypothetical protein